MRFKSAMSSLGTSSAIRSDAIPASGATSILDLPMSEVSSSGGPTESANRTTPAWVQEVTAFSTRPSRASSIVSTRTRFSVTTQDDARSIDITAGGQNFRINRDASRITSEAPPPYSSHSSAASVATIQEEPPQLDEPERAMGSRRNSGETVQGPTMDDPEDVSFLGANILDPSEVDIPSPVDSLHMEHNQPSSWSWRRRHGRQPNSKLEQRPASVTPSRRTLSSHAILEDASSVSPAPKMSAPRSRLHLSPLSTNVLQENYTNSVSGGVAIPASLLSRERHSADPALPTEARNEDVPQSPAYIGRNAPGVFPFPQFFSTSKEQRSSSVLDQYARGSATTSGENISVQHDPADSTIATSIDSENDVSLHYTRMIRYIDREHRRALHLKDKELAGLRERLNEVDMVYRQELRARDFVIDDLKKRLEHLEESTEIKIERARNQVEETWEQRWRDRDFHLRERMHRIEVDAQKDLDRLMERLAAGESA